MSILLAFSIILSMGFIATPAMIFAGTWVGATIDDNVVQGDVFLIRYEMNFNKATQGFFSVVTWWENLSPGGANRKENFTLENWRVYWEATGNPLDNIVVTEVATAKGWKVKVECTGESTNGDAIIDLWLRAASEGALHRPDNNRLIIYNYSIREDPDLYIVPEAYLYIDVLPWVWDKGVILRGKDNAYNIDQNGPEPMVWYSEGDNPPILVAERYISPENERRGAVAAGGFASTCRNTRWNTTYAPENLRNLDQLLDMLFQWMKPCAENVLWYQGHNVYNKIENATHWKYDNCADLADALRAKGYNVVADNFEPITLADLLPYDIVIIPQLQEGSGWVGGDPTLLLDSEVEALKQWVENENGGLLVLEGSDYKGYNFYRVQNKILKHMISGNFQWFFQHDQVNDPVNNSGVSYSPYIHVENSNPIGAYYQAHKGVDQLVMYSICSLIDRPTYGVDVTITPHENRGENGDIVTFRVTLRNTGTVWDNFNLTLSDDGGWPELSWLPMGVAPITSTWIVIPAGGENDLYFQVKIPENAAPSSRDNILVVATGFHDPEQTKDNDNAVAHFYLGPGVEVTIVPDSQWGKPGDTLDYTVTVKNTGGIVDNFDLIPSDDAGFGLMLDNIRFENVPPKGSRTTKLHVTIPQWAVDCTKDNIWVTAVSEENSEVRDNDNCVAAVDASPPVIDNALAIPDMISLMEGALDEYYGEGAYCGPYRTTLIIDAHDKDNKNEIVNVTKNLRPLFEQMFADLLEENLIDNMDAWEMLLKLRENVPMYYNYYQCTVYWEYFYIYDDIFNFIWDLFDYGAIKIEEPEWDVKFFEILSEKIQLGDFVIPVTVTDAVGNENTVNIELAIVDIVVPLRQGWNLRSTPVTLADGRWGSITSLGEGLEYDAAIRWDAENQKWVYLTTDYVVKPLEAIYIHTTARDQLGLAFARTPLPTAPPVRQLYSGWNLVGLAALPFPPWEYGDWWMYVDDALISAHQTSEGLKGYIQVVSPYQDIGGYYPYGSGYYYKTYSYGGCYLDFYLWYFLQEQWIYTRGELYTVPEMWILGGYWVYMDNPDELAGFSYTPIPYEKILYYGYYWWW
jgi:hypothetical protein